MPKLPLSLIPVTDDAGDRQQHPTTPEQFRPGRTLAVITTIGTREKGYIFAKGVADDEEYFCHVSGVPAEVWPDLLPGDAVTCRVSVTSKGLRAFAVRRATEGEQVSRAAEWEESRGNR